MQCVACLLSIGKPQPAGKLCVVRLVGGRLFPPSRDEACQQGNRADDPAPGSRGCPGKTEDPRPDKHNKANSGSPFKLLQATQECDYRAGDQAEPEQSWLAAEV